MYIWATSDGGDDDDDNEDDWFNDAGSTIIMRAGARVCVKYV
jgi:hypothetical protein